MGFEVGGRVSRYELVELIGRGGLGEVWKARDLILDRLVAIKLITRTVDPVERTRLLQEGRAAGRLRHEHIVVIYDVDVLNDPPFLVMELLAGPSLAARLNDGHLEVEEAIRFATQVAEALRHAHRADFVHRDIKPSNLVFDSEDCTRLKICDFGIVKFRGADFTSAVTSQGFGSAHWAPPQQWSGQVDARADLYALGSVLFAMLTRRPPFIGDECSVREQHASVKPPAPSSLRPDVPLALDQLVAHLLEKAPEDRPRDAAAVIHHLESIQSPPPIQLSDPPTATTYAPGRRIWRECAIAARQEDAGVEQSPEGVPRVPGIDTTRPHPARIYDYGIGGKNHFAVDRAVADQVLAVMPGARTLARENRKFLGRAVRFLAAEAGIRQFLDIGSGLPATDNVHEVAQRVDPSCRVVYVDNDPSVLPHARALLASAREGRTGYFTGDLRKPEEILADPVTGEILDFGKPIGLVLVSVLPFLVDDDQPAKILATLLGALPPGSYLAATHSTAEHDPDGWEGTKRAYSSAGIQGQVRDSSDFARMAFSGLDLVPPGVVLVSEWRPDEPGPRPLPAEVSCYGGVGRIGGAGGADGARHA